MFHGLPEFPKSANFEGSSRTDSAQGRTKYMSSVKATQLRPGMVIQHEGQLYTVFSVDHRTPGNKRGSMQTRMRNLRTGAMIDYRFRAEEFVDRAILDEIEFEYLYSEGDDFHFMNTKNYEQMQMSREELGETVYYLIPSTIVKVEFFDEKAIGVDLPDTMDMKVVQDGANAAESHRQRGDEACDTRNRLGRSGAAVRERRRQNQSGHFGSALRSARRVILVLCSLVRLGRDEISISASAANFSASRN